MARNRAAALELFEDGDRAAKKFAHRQNEHPLEINTLSPAGADERGAGGDFSSAPVGG